FRRDVEVSDPDQAVGGRKTFIHPRLKSRIPRQLVGELVAANLAALGYVGVDHPSRAPTASNQAGLRIRLIAGQVAKHLVRRILRDERYAVEGGLSVGLDMPAGSFKLVARKSLVLALDLLQTQHPRFVQLAPLQHGILP